MKFLIAVSIIFAVYVSSQDENKEIANKIGYDVIEKLLNLFKKDDRAGLEVIYDNWFIFQFCKANYSKTQLIDMGLTNKTEVELEYNITNGVLTDTELRFHMISKLLNGREELDFVDYICRRETVDDEWTIWRTNFTRCDLVEADQELLKNETLQQQLSS